MKTKSVLFRPLMALGLAAAALLSAPTSWGAAAVPYAVDTNTLHLWQNYNTNYDANNLQYITDWVSSGSVNFTNVGSVPGGGSAGTPPFSNIFNVSNVSMPFLGNCLDILPANGGNQPGTSASYASYGTASNNEVAPTAFCSSSTGAFTFEALVNPQGNIFSSSAGNGEWEILCGDNTGSANEARGWQFRLNNGAAPAMNFNMITATGTAVPSQTVTLPTTGPDALATNQWYHIAVTYSGTSGANPNQLIIYWTLFDTNRTSCDVLYSNTFAGDGTLGGTPIPAIGGSARTTKGIGNLGCFQGLIDEVRVSSIARAATNMAFGPAVVINPPRITSEPPAVTLVGYGKPLAVNTVVQGSLPIYYQWQKSNSIGGWSNVLTQTNNSYTVPAVAFSDAGFYQMIASNAALTSNVVTSTVAQVSIGAAFSELFNTGCDASNNPIAGGGTADLHYLLSHSADTNNLGPTTLDWTMGTSYPLASGGGAFANSDGVSGWLGPQANSYTSPDGTYTYRINFLLDSVDLTQPLSLTGTWWANANPTNILLNGQSLGISGVLNLPIAGAGFNITSGFVQGMNTLDFVTINNGNNGSYLESGFRAELSGLGQALPAGLPSIVSNVSPVQITDALTTDAGVATFAVVATGRPPLSYQWYGDGSTTIANGLQGGDSVSTNRVLTIQLPSPNAQPVNYKCVVSNGSGSATSSVVQLTFVETNRPPVTPNYNSTAYENTSTTFDISTLYNNSYSPNGYTLVFNGINATTTPTLGTLTEAGTTLTYTPPTNYTGADSFTYTVTDSSGVTPDSSTGTNFINVVAVVPPVLHSVALSGGNIVLSGSNGAAGGTYHVLTSTNVGTPLTNWTILGPYSFSGTGTFSYTNAVSTNPPARFYRIEVP